MARSDEKVQQLRVINKLYTTSNMNESTSIYHGLSSACHGRCFQQNFDEVAAKPEPFANDSEIYCISPPPPSTYDTSTSSTTNKSALLIKSKQHLSLLYQDPPQRNTVNNKNERKSVIISMTRRWSSGPQCRRAAACFAAKTGGSACLPASFQC